MVIAPGKLLFLGRTSSFGLQEKLWLYLNLGE